MKRPYYPNLLLKRARKVTRLRIINDMAQAEARVWSKIRAHCRIKDYDNYLNSLR
jgi:hypothetical protein